MTVSSTVDLADLLDVEEVPLSVVSVSNSSLRGIMMGTFCSSA